VGHILEKVKKAIDIEIESLQNFRLKLDPRFEDAIQLIMEMKGKVIITGVGKSGDIAKKISSTMTSTGTEAIFLHPTDATHGDAGLIKKEDIILAIGKSGESDELIALIPTIKRIGAKLIALTANPSSKLAQSADIVIITPVLKEACPLDLAPTSSTTIALVAGDAIAFIANARETVKLSSAKRANAISFSNLISIASSLYLASNSSHCFR
jgi:arabinose-5-phosphate isomerase